MTLYRDHDSGRQLEWTIDLCLGDRVVVWGGVSRSMRMFYPPKLGPGIQLDESFPDSQDRGLRAVVYLKLMKDIPHVVFDGLLA